MRTGVSCSILDYHVTAFGMRHWLDQHQCTLLGDISATRFCIAHGGGRRCTYLGCDKGARDKYFCAAWVFLCLSNAIIQYISSGFGSIYHFPNSHGGGKRCKLDGCHKSAVGGSLYCTGHGGGKRCSVLGCDKSAQSSTKFCVKHGGGKKCSFDGCKKVARGRTLFCAAVSNIPTIWALFMCLLLTIFNAF